MERLSGKLLVDTYSKRSQTLIEKVHPPSFRHSAFDNAKIYAGERIGEIDGRVRGNLHREVRHFFNSPALVKDAFFFADLRAL
jgi:hypothetical protein